MKEIFQEIEIIYHQLVHTILDNCFKPSTHIREIWNQQNFILNIIQTG